MHRWFCKVLKVALFSDQCQDDEHKKDNDENCLPLRRPHYAYYCHAVKTAIVCIAYAVSRLLDNELQRFPFDRNRNTYRARSDTALFANNNKQTASRRKKATTQLIANMRCFAIFYGLLEIMREARNKTKESAKQRTERNSIKCCYS